jgi:hypothetical protein
LAQQGNALVLHSPGGHRTSCASATAIENDENRYLIDDLDESKECRLVTPILGIPRTVAYGLARPLVEGTLFNSHSILKGYAIVLMDVEASWNTLERMVNGNLERTLAVMSYGASGTLSLARKTLKLPVGLVTATTATSFATTTRASTFVATTTTAMTFVAATTTATTYVTTTTTADSSTVTTTKDCSAAATTKDSSVIAQEDNFAF